MDYKTKYKDYCNEIKQAGYEPCGFYEWLTDTIDNSLSDAEAKAIINNNKGVISMKAYVTIEFTNGWKKRNRISMPNLSEAMKYINCHRLALKQFGYSNDVMTSYIEHI